jgi:hypothetical protein
MPTSASRAHKIARRYTLGNSGRLFAIGTFDDRVTVLSQQRRALNLAWALIQAKRLPTRRDEAPINVAIVGAGFAGLTFAAALLQKECRCAITMFEERDTLLPLQQGSDTRWLHPHIYDWPEEGSNVAAAMLPVLSWTAGRASDVVVQVLHNWSEMLKEHQGHDPKLYCNTRHLQVRRADENAVEVEWVGEHRRTNDGSSLVDGSGAKGQSAVFDLVVLAVGFGLEVDNQFSYWRNEVLGQPSLSQPRRTFLISGQGDGAMIDLLRLKVSQFRQDRILAELFAGKDELLNKLRALRSEFLNGSPDFLLFSHLDALCRDDLVKAEMLSAIQELSMRLRRDTDIVLRLKVRNIADLLKAGTSRISFQNALLVYLLYRCGGFAPSSEDELELVTRFGISPGDVIRRHGTKRIEQLLRLLPPEICKPIEKTWNKDRCADLRQTADIQWSGGYFGVTGREEDFPTVKDQERTTWRKEYLPGPTALLAIAITSAVAGEIERLRPKARHFRVTIHRVLSIHGEELLQQACDYIGRNLDDAKSTAGRTFPAQNATIGQAYLTRRIVRSQPGIRPVKLNEVMEKLSLNQASRKMSSEVGFLAAIPIVQPENDFYDPSPVCAVVYFDSRDKGFDISDRELAQVVRLVERIVDSVRRGTGVPLDRLENTSLFRRADSAKTAARIAPVARSALLSPDIDPPRVKEAFVFNHDHSDLTPLD